MHHQINRNTFINQVNQRFCSISSSKHSFLATDHAPFVRSYDENNGRVVYNYTPETCGYVSDEIRWKGKGFSRECLVCSIAYWRE